MSLQATQKCSHELRSNHNHSPLFPLALRHVAILVQLALLMNYPLGKNTRSSIIIAFTPFPTHTSRREFEGGN